MSRIACARSVLALACILALTQRAHAQTQPTTIPLDVISESGGGYAEDRLGINIGVNGATPEEYIFDTGSTAFNIDVGSGSSGQSWFPIVSGVPITPTSPALSLYGNGTYGNLGANTTVSSVQFYNSSSNSVAASYTNGQGIPVLINQGAVATAGSLNGDQAGAQIGYYLPAYGYAFTFAEIAAAQAAGSNVNTQGELPIYLDATWQQNLNQGIGPEDGGTYKLFGIFGAGEFGSNSILGNLTTSGYIVAANAELGSPQNCSGCDHVILNLTPALRAQFISLVPWNGGSQSTFPLSGAPVSANQFDLTFAYTLNGGKYSATLQTLLDSGTPTIYLNDAGLLAGETAAGHVDQYGNEIAGVTLTMTGVAPGAQPTSITTGNDNGGDQSNVVTPGNITFPNGSSSDPDTSPGQALYGISFFFNNSVMYDLQNQETGYTPFFVSIDPISTGTNGYTISGAVAPQGIAGIISGSGPLIIASGGTAQLTGANTYTGATLIAQGGWLGLAGPGTIADSSGVQADGTLDISRTSGPALIQSLSGAGNVELGANTLELTNASGTFAGVLADGGLVGGTGGSLVIAQGTETLTGTNTFTGSTGIGSAGALVLDGSLAGSVLDAGVLAGHGAIGGGLVVTGAIAPGTGAGTYQTLTVAGNYLQSAGAIYLAQLNLQQAGVSSQIVVNGKATLAPGATVDVVPSAGQLFSKGARYTLLTADQGLTGTYALTGGTSLSAVLAITPFYDADHFYLDVTQQQSLINVGQTRNQVATLAAIQALPASSAPFTTVANLQTDSQIRYAADQLSGEIYASAQNVFLEDSRFVRDAVTTRLRQAGPDGQNLDETSGQTVKTQANGLAWWGQFVGSWGHHDSTSDDASMSHTLGGFLVGADMGVGSNSRVGVVTGYTQTSINVNQRGSNVSSDDVHVGVYAGTQLGALGLSAGAAYTQHSFNANRSIFLPDYAGHLRDSNDAYTAQLFGEADYRFQFKSFALEPFAQGAYVRLNMDGSQEHGASVALSTNGDSRSVTYTTLGTRASTHFVFNGDFFTAHASLGWRHAFGNTQPDATVAFANGDPFTVQGLPIARNALAVDTGLDLHVNKRATISLSYNGQIAAHAVDSGVKGGFAWQF
jgi:subtilase-type serine protease